MPSEVNTNTSKSFFFDLRKILFLCLLSVLLILIGPTGIFAPVPLVFIFLLFNASLGVITGVIALMVLITLSVAFKITPILSILFFLTFINAVLIALTILKKLSPDKGLVTAGIAYLVIISLGVGGYLLSGKDYIEKELTSVVTKFADQIKKENTDLIAQGGEDARMLQDLLNDPKTMVSNAIMWTPVLVFTLMMFGYWGCFLIMLRTSIMWKTKRTYEYTIRHLINFKAPDFLIWPLIMALVLMIGGEYALGQVGHMLGVNFLYFLGIFFFIQGIGVYYDVLQLIGIRGAIRSLLIVIAAVLAYKILALIGVFDRWINFHQWVKKLKKHKGDNL